MHKMTDDEIKREVLSKLETMRTLIYSNEMREVISAVKDKNIILFIGNTRCGKSTIVNYVIGNALIAEKKKYGRQYFITKQDNNIHGPVIGSGSSSETTIPSAYISSKIDVLIVDAPGFDDNRGEEQDVANSFYIKEIINNARSVKFALINDIADIAYDNIGNFVSFVDKILYMLPSHGELHKGMIMVFNKDNENFTRQRIGELLKEKIINLCRIHVKNRQLVNYMKKNLSQIAIVKMPTKPGIIDGPEVFGDLIETIKNNAIGITKHEMSAIVPGISDKSRAFLLEAHRHLTEMKEFEDVLNILLQEFKRNLSKYDISKESRTFAEGKRLNEELLALENNIQSITRKHYLLFEKLDQLKTLIPGNKLLDENTDIYIKFKFVSFIDSVLNIKEGEIANIKIDGVLYNMLDITASTRVRLQEKRLEISEEESNRKLKEIADANQKAIDQFMKQIAYLKRQNEELLEKQRRQFCSIL